ncbi:DEAD/DEAH box helicase family protein [Trichococcus sp. K1Tr]|uniref:TOTE conflict system archaeo-eukaryotic primase domain-containing protein n=1 Tax=Trichococcus sp. K1Tr TaxID=3020847 RepID=UPI00232A7FD5|nr:DEAD/DEAH box helicase family protein [Trichococcus sp. K1Tr]MDB6354173.1 DEAD/DEAH box helicase family protein [Trichococcus sp. K1Tr]
MDPENLSEKYHLLLQENQLLKEHISLLESALKQAEVYFVEGAAGDYHQSNFTNIPIPSKGDPSPEPEKKSVPTLNKYSSPSEKIRLFMSLFKGREDVFAHKYFNKKQGKMVYGPMKSKPWERKPGDGEYAPFDERVVDHHLRGFDGMIAGVFPICLDDSCHFLAIDLDKGEWQRDAEVLREVCHQFAIPVSIERSQSGNGAHVWFFFAQPVPAKKARKFGSALLTAAMNRRHELKIASFDRLFPNQDSLPSGGFGNLIALPLQKTARQHGNSEFVDEAFRSYEDQWAYLASIKKIPAEDISLFLEKLQTQNGTEDFSENAGTSEGLKPWKKKEIVLTKADFPDQVKITLANRIYIEKAELTEHALSYLKRRAVFHNPAFYIAQNSRKSTHNITRLISCSAEDAQYIGLPRGFQEKVMALFESLDIPVSVTDDTVSGDALRVDFKGELWPEQEKAVANLLVHDNGILCGTTAFGKTVSALNIIAEKQVNTLIIVNRTSLVSMWREKINEFLDFKDAENEKEAKKMVGQLGAGKKKLTQKIDIALLQSLYHEGEAHECLQDYGMVIVDECHHLSAVSFEQALQATTAKYVYGLTATPTRKDGLQQIVFMQCGPIRYRDNAKKQAKARPFDHKVRMQFTPFDPTIRQDMSLQQVYQQISENEERNSKLVADIISNYREGRNAIILTERVAHVKRLEELLREEIPDVVAITGGMGRKTEREKMQQIRNAPTTQPLTIVSTGSFIGEGFDEPRLDTLFLAMPISWKGRLHQYAGRLHRLYEGKTEVRIYDYVDVHVPVLERMYRKRLTGYAGIGYTVELADQEAASRSLMYTGKNYADELKENLLSAKSEIVLVSPALAGKTVATFLNTIKPRIPTIVAVSVMTKSADSIVNPQHRANRTQLIESLADKGIDVQQQDVTGPKCVLIDRKIVWYGSIDVLGNQSNDASFIRLESTKLAEELYACFGR